MARAIREQTWMYVDERVKFSSLNSPPRIGRWDVATPASRTVTDSTIHVENRKYHGHPGGQAIFRVWQEGA